MHFEIVEISSFSGRQAKVYSIIPAGETETLFDKFLNEYRVEYGNELKDIVKTIYHMGHTTGARSSFFKMHEGKYGDFVCALFDLPEKNLRLFCIRLGMVAVIIGGGGGKPKGVRAWQDDEKLSNEAYLMIAISRSIMQRLDSGELYWSEDKTEILGNF